jgi:hypothetical protein
MTVGKANTRYHVTLRKCTDGEMPVITPCDVGKEKYDLIQLIIHDRYGLKLDADGIRKMRKGGGRK